MKIHIAGAHPYNGSHPLDFSSLTNQDHRIIKKTAGISPMQYLEAMSNGDIELQVALALIALRHAGHWPINEQAIWDAPQGSITL